MPKHHTSHTTYRRSQDHNRALIVVITTFMYILMAVGVSAGLRYLNGGFVYSGTWSIIGGFSTGAIGVFLSSLLRMTDPTRR